jgi:hypothetical protein
MRPRPSAFRVLLDDFTAFLHQIFPSLYNVLPLGALPKPLSRIIGVTLPLN